MMNKEHPNYVAVIAWANGETIQYRSIGYYDEDDWYDWETHPRHDTPDFTRFDWEWRPKPKMKKIVWRAFLYKSDLTGKICIDVIEEDDLRFYNPEGGEDFICWCEDDWQMIEVETLSSEEEEE